MKAQHPYIGLRAKYEPPTKANYKEGVIVSVGARGGGTLDERDGFEIGAGVWLLLEDGSHCEAELHYVTMLDPKLAHEALACNAWKMES